MEEEESGEVVVEEESIIINCVMGGVEERWMEISTAGEEVATITWVVGKGVAVIATSVVAVVARVEVASGEFGYSSSSSSPSWSGSS